MQMTYEQVESRSEPFNHVIFCSQNKGKKFLVTWEEEPESRKHIATKIQAVSDDYTDSTSKGMKNLRAATEAPCPFCGNAHNTYCSTCKEFICYNGYDKVLKCVNCGKKYKFKDAVDFNFDVKAF